VPRHDYRIGVPHGCDWREIFNSDSCYYGGSNLGNDGNVESTVVSAHGQRQSLQLTLPPLATIFLRHEG
jgi:1,4-alpha-glucan branching enzyme